MKHGVWFAVAFAGIAANLFLIDKGHVTLWGVANLVAGIFLLGMITDSLLDKIPKHSPQVPAPDKEEEKWRKLLVKEEQ